MRRALQWLADRLYPPEFGLVVVLVLVCGVLYGIMGLMDRAHYRGEARACRLQADSIAATIADGTTVWVAPSPSPPGTKLQDTVRKPYIPRR